MPSLRWRLPISSSLIGTNFKESCCWGRLMRLLHNRLKEMETLLIMMSKMTSTGVSICPDFAKVSEAFIRKTYMAVSGRRRKKSQLQPSISKTSEEKRKSSTTMAPLLTQQFSIKWTATQSKSGPSRKGRTRKAAVRVTRMTSCKGLIGHLWRMIWFGIRSLLIKAARILHKIIDRSLMQGTMFFLICLLKLDKDSIKA